ncbi:hypothetical protein Vadar_003725 [Vaccinium darrowii]|uniref:Uncharacterized protein n=1 Tax=Vaccinium darrowii TaxID=229202 RepID=A0ACB7WY58_9ERIC|nr:hypothetical protein Vadar_003725 [Vaccinium darrowii]
MTILVVGMLVVVVVLPTVVVGQCDCDLSEGEGSKSQALKLKLAAIASILVAGAIGVYSPILGKSVQALGPEKDAFFIMKTFAAGVILATGCCHVLPDAFDKLTSPCLTGVVWNFPWAGFVLMLSAIFTLMTDNLATSYYSKSLLAKSSNRGAVDEEKMTTGEQNASHVHVHTHANHGHSHGSAVGDDELVSKELIRHRVIAQVLELGIVVHSVIIGLALGASQSPSTIGLLLQPYPSINSLRAWDLVDALPR